MNLKVRCCCEAPNVQVQFIELEPVIPLPANAQLIENVTWWLDLGDVVELNTFTEIYEGGQASTFGVPIFYGSDFVVVPSKGDPQVWWDDGDITGQTNLANLFSLRHRGWKKKEPPRQVSFEQLADIGGTRIVWQKPAGVADDQIDQLEGDGIFFAAAQLFDQNPALVTSRTSTDFGGDTVGYTVGYNPKKECVKPEQGRYYGTESHPKLLFDFTAQFPDQITLEYKFPSLDDGNDVTVTRTYSKFVLGGETSPTTEFLDLDQFGQGVSVVTGFDDEDPESSNNIKFGYRNDNENYVIWSGGNRVALIPSIPFFWVSAGRSSIDIFFSCKIGEGSSGMNAVRDGFNTTTQKLVAGDKLQDITYYPESAEQTGEQTPSLKIPTQGTNPLEQPKRLFPDAIPFPFRAGDSQFGSVIEYQCASYKGAVAITSNYTLSLRTAYPVSSFLPQTNFEFFMTTQFATNNDGPSAPPAIPTFNFPAFAWGEDPTQLRLEPMSNPLSGPNHPLSRSNFTGIISGRQFPQIPTFFLFNTPIITLS
tara:strand:- start:158 stop:1762 length:1605 start_codon:yes stop_codon:yes gene_type:complete